MSLPLNGMAKIGLWMLCLIGLREAKCLYKFIDISVADSGLLRSWSWASTGLVGLRGAAQHCVILGPLHKKSRFKNEVGFPWMIKQMGCSLHLYSFYTDQTNID